jgi:RNA polymerase sigma-70 factor (ECF subfamily)
MIQDLALPHRLPTSVVEPGGGEACLDEAAFRVFYETTAARLRNYLRRTAGNAALAEDIVQEAYLRFLQSPGRTSARAEPAAFLFRIATNLLYDHWRRAGRERRLLSWLRPTPAAGDASLKHDVGRLLEELKPRERALLWLAYVEGWSHDEIARILSVRPRSVRVLLFRARSRLAGLLARARLGVEARR